MLSDVLQEKRNLILGVAKEHGIQNVRVFGSVAKSEDGPTSDLDLIVDFEDGRSLFDTFQTRS